MEPNHPTASAPSSAEVKYQQKLHLAIVVGLFAVMMVLSAVLGSGEAKKAPSSSPKATPKTIVLENDHIDNSAIWLHRAENALAEQRKAIDTLKEQLAKMDQEKKSEQNLEKNKEEAINALQQQYHALEHQLTVQQKSLSAILPEQAVDGKGDPLTALPVSSAKAISDVTLSTTSPTFRRGIKQEELRLTPREDANTASTTDKTPENYVPAGTFVKAVLLSGLDAAAGVTSQGQPRPVILRLIDDGTLPNHLSSHLKDCLVTGAGYGDISSERVYIRLERMSCTRKNHTLMDMPVYGYVSGADGKAGIRGRAVWRENALLQRSFISGFFSGLGQGVSSVSSPTPATLLDGASPLMDSTHLFKGGIASGASTALGKLADYNIRRAEQYQPIIEVNAAKVNVIFHLGFYVDGSQKTDTPSTESPTTAPATPLNTIVPS